MVCEQRLEAKGVKIFGKGRGNGLRHLAGSRCARPKTETASHKAAGLESALPSALGDCVAFSGLSVPHQPSALHVTLMDGLAAAANVVVSYFEHRKP